LRKEYKVESTTNTPYSNRCEILGELWLDYKEDKDMQDFIEYNDLGLPLAFAIVEGIVESTPIAEGYINETFDLLLASLEIEDKGFEDINDLLGTGE
jgi:hypothetical protein